MLLLLCAGMESWHGLPHRSWLSLADEAGTSCSVAARSLKLSGATLMHGELQWHGSWERHEFAPACIMKEPKCVHAP